MRQKVDDFLGDMLSESNPKEHQTRLDDVAEMVQQMEDNIKSKIDEANKIVVEKMLTNEVAGKSMNEVVNNDNNDVDNESNYGGNENEDNISTD